MKLICKLIFLFSIAVLLSASTGRKCKKRTKCQRPVPFAAGHTSPPSCECGLMQEPPSAEYFIVNGTVVGPPNKYPWMVFLTDKENHTRCGGSIISSSFVLTAAHCGKNIKREDSFFRIGIREKDSTVSKLFPVRKIFRHPRHNITSSLYDVALVQLPKPFACSQFIRPICLPINVPTPKAGTEVIVAGWGRIVEDDFFGMSEKLREGRLKIQAKDVCDKVEVNKDKTTHLCAQHETQSICLGDSGGPLFRFIKGKAYIFGITSYLISKICDEKYPQFFSDVKKSLDWIQQTIRNK